MAEQAPASESDEAFPPALIVLCGIVVLVILGLVLELFTTPVISALITVIIGLTALSVWQREAIDRFLKQRKQQAAERRQAAEKAEAEKAAAEVEAEPSDEPDTLDSSPPGEAVPPAAEAETVVFNKPKPMPVDSQPEVTFELIEPGASPGNQVAQPLPVAQPAPDERPVTAPEQTEPVPEPAPEPQSLTDGLPEQYHSFLDAAMTQSKWPARELEAMARMHNHQWGDVLDAINKWSQDRFGDPMLLQDGDEVWIQLPLL